MENEIYLSNLNVSKNKLNELKTIIFQIFHTYGSRHNFDCLINSSFDSFHDIHKLVNVQWLIRLIDEHLHVIRKTFFPGKQLIIATMWANVCSLGHFQEPHTHYPNVIAGVFYIEARNTTIKFILDGLVHEVPVKTNDIILFSGNMEHFFDKQVNDQSRVSLAFNVICENIDI